jgi:nucleoside-diphosphate-sugar epimerase|tara:strand:+ start:2061 stop:2906 length:846 start_codon:yes stop_codon:yes gene_type:complete
LEIREKLLIVGCGKLGLKIGNVLSKKFEITGIKRKKPIKESLFQILEVDIFSKDFTKKIKSINPNYIIYSVAADNQTEELYQNAYVNGLRLSINASLVCSNIKHFFFISSTRVYGQKSEDFLSELTEPLPNDFGGRALLEGENLVKNMLLPSTTLRLSGIYGVDRAHMVALAKRPEDWPVNNRWTNRIHEDDIVHFIIFLLDKIKETPLEPLYLLTDNSPTPIYDVLNLIRVELNLPPNKKIGNGKPVGKKLKSKIIPGLNFHFKYSDYLIGYKSIVNNIK